MNRLRPTIALLAILFACGQEQVRPPAFDVDNVMRHVHAQCDLGPRLPNTPARDSTAAYIARVAKSYGATVSAQSFSIEDPYGERMLEFINVTASFAPERTRRVMLAAHYDSRPWADEEPDTTLHDQPVPGAVDGAAATAVLLEMGRLVGAVLPKEIGVDLVFFDGEDYGKTGDLKHYLIGSKYFATNRQGYRPVCAILLDMVGGEGSRVGREGYSRENVRALTDTLFARATRMGLDYFHDVNGPPIYDDHVPLIQAGIDAVNLFGYDYKYWHTIADTPDKVRPDQLEQVARLLVDFVYDFPF